MHEGVPRRALLQMVAAFPGRAELPVLMPAVGEDFEEAQDYGADSGRWGARE